MKEFTLSLHAEIEGNLLIVPMDAEDMDSTLEELCVTYLVPMSAELGTQPMYLRRSGVAQA